MQDPNAEWVTSLGPCTVALDWHDTIMDVRIVASLHAGHAQLIDGPPFCGLSGNEADGVAL